MLAVAAKDNQSASSFRKIAALAKPEKKPLTLAVGLLLVSSSVSMSIPFTVGKLIDYFTTANPVGFYHIILPPNSLLLSKFPMGLRSDRRQGSYLSCLLSVHWRTQDVQSLCGWPVNVSLPVYGSGPTPRRLDRKWNLLSVEKAMS